MMNWTQRIPVLLLLWLLQACPVSAQQPNPELPHVSADSRDEVLIGGEGVRIPLERILLVRKGTDCCAVKFVKFWTGKTEEDYLGSYERYYQGDGSADFTTKNVQFQIDEVLYPRVRGSGAFAIQFGEKDLRCGSIQLQWMGNGNVSFYTRSRFTRTLYDAGVELAPTHWTSIVEVNAHDPRIKWYRLDSHRKRIIIPIDRLWDKPADEKKQPADGVEPTKPENKKE